MRGNENITGLVQRLRPRAVIPFENATFPSEGRLSSLVKEVGSAQELPRKLQVATLLLFHIVLDPTPCNNMVGVGVGMGGARLKILQNFY